MEELRHAAREFFPQSQEAACWAAQDCMPADQIPYIGRYASGNPNWFVVTGFQKWGMTSSMVAAMILKDLICGRENPYGAIFRPQRFSTGELPQIVGDGVEAVKGLAKGIFQIPHKAPRCSHMGCQLSWNSEEETWDCPCHGSRFDSQGNLLEGPAQKGICHGHKK